MKWHFTFTLFLILPTLAWGQESQTYRFGVTQDGYLPPARHNAYGPGLDADAAGKPFYWAPQNQPSTMQHNNAPDATIRVKPDAYGLGVGSDQYGRPMQRKNWP